MIIDAHQHFWSLERGDYGWLTPDCGTPDCGTLYQDFQPSDLKPELEAAGVSATVLVQAAPTIAETKFLLGIAESTAFVQGVIGWVEMTTPEAVESIQQLSANPYLKGLRPMIQDLPKDDWVLGASLDNAFSYLERSGLVFEALVFPRHLQYLLSRLTKHPELKVVIDHVAKPDIYNGDSAPLQQKQWREHMKRLALETSSRVKLSGLFTEARACLSLAQARPWFDAVFEWFSADRIIWGSDWPVLTVYGQYQDWFDLCQNYCQGLSAEDRDNIFGNNAKHFYSL